MREQASPARERVVSDTIRSRYRTVTIGALIALAVIIVTGAAVRLTNSGLGCDDWPHCNSERLIDMSSTHAAIEQGNRLFTGVVVVAVAAAVLGSYRQRPRRRDLIWWSWSLVAGVFANALLGAVTVWVDLHPFAVQGHLLLSLMLIAAGVTLVRRAGEPADVARRTDVGTQPEPAGPQGPVHRCHHRTGVGLVVDGGVRIAHGCLPACCPERPEVQGRAGRSPGNRHGH